MDRPDGEVDGQIWQGDGIGYFPDAPTDRGVKHLRELAKAASEGYRAYLTFVIQMAGVTKVLPNMINWDGKDKDTLALIKYIADGGENRPGGRLV